MSLALEKAFSSLPTQTLRQTFFRVIHAKYAATALSAVGSFRFGGRYNPAGQFEALYLADSPVTALEEVVALLRTNNQLQGVKGPPRILLSVDCDLSSVLMLSDHLDALGLAEPDLLLPWRDSLRRSEVPITQCLGALAFERKDIEGLLVSSAKNPATKNLVVFPDRLQAGSSLRVFDDSGLIDSSIS